MIYGREELALDEVYIDMEAAIVVHNFHERPIVLDQGLPSEAPHEVYIIKHGWQAFVNGRDNLLKGDKIVLYEFLANLHSIRKDKVIVQGKIVDYTFRQRLSMPSTSYQTNPVTSI